MDRLPENNARIETYLNEVSVGLQYMSAEEAVETLGELRQHIGALVKELCEGGASEEEAVTAAQTKFGPANRVGLQLGAKSMQQFLSGLAAAPSSQVSQRDNVQSMLSLALLCVSYGLIPLTFWPGSHFVAWSCLAALAGAVIYGYLIQFRSAAMV